MSTKNGTTLAKPESLAIKPRSSPPVSSNTVLPNSTSLTVLPQLTFACVVLEAR